MKPAKDRASHLGMRPGELEGAWFAPYWNPAMASLPEHVREAVLVGPQPAELLPPLESAPQLVEPGYQELENGYGIAEDGSLYVAVLTEMRDVDPAMWDWWFWWHGSESRRYRLWHPRAHMFAQWADPQNMHTGMDDRQRYVGRTSFVDEYLGNVKSELSIRFIPPGDLGLDETALADPVQATAICARGGLSNLPLDAGYLVHHVRAVPGGAQMRSRFWLGGRYVGSRSASALADPVLKIAAATVMKRTEQQAEALLIHCAQEMNHLAAFLPRIHREFNERGAPA